MLGRKIALTNLAPSRTFLIGVSYHVLSQHSNLEDTMATPTHYTIRWNGVAECDQPKRLHTSMTDAIISALSIQHAAMASETDPVAYALLARLTFSVQPISIAL